MDSVDVMVSAWHTSRPGLDVSPLEVVGRLLLCAHHLERALVDALRPLGLSYGDFDVINTLRRIGTPDGINPRTLARSSLITSGAMTARLDRLAEAGLIDRAMDPGDRRAVRICLTEQGTQLADRALAAVLETDQEFLRPLDEDTRDTAVTVLRQLLAPYEPRSGDR